MGRAARWIRLQCEAQEDFDAACEALAAAQDERAAPIVLWARVEERHAFAIVVPQRHAPGRRSRWAAWALTPAIAAYRRIGLPAYLEGEAICLHGREVERSATREIGACAVVAASFLPRFPAEPYLEALFRACIEAQHGWAFETSWPSREERAALAGEPLEAALQR